jgi:hypothetical protein
MRRRPGVYPIWDLMLKPRRLFVESTKLTTAVAFIAIAFAIKMCYDSGIIYHAINHALSVALLNR